MLANIKCFYIMISCPSDVTESENALRIINEWNSKYTKDFLICFIPLFWQINSTTNINGERPQEILNKSLVYQSDCIVVIFWSKFGSNTGKEASGTLEELKKAYELKKKIGLFFCEKPISPSFINPKDLEQIKTVKDNFGNLGIYQNYNHEFDFQAKFNHFLHEFAGEIDKSTEAEKNAAPVITPIENKIENPSKLEQILSFNLNEPVLTSPKEESNQTYWKSSTEDLKKAIRNKDLNVKGRLNSFFEANNFVYDFLEKNPLNPDKRILEKLQLLNEILETSNTHFYQVDLEHFRKTMSTNTSKALNFIKLYYKIEGKNLVPSFDLKDNITNETHKVIQDYEKSCYNILRSFRRINLIFDKVYSLESLN